jgi:hypothetical protein
MLGLEERLLSSMVLKSLAMMGFLLGLKWVGGFTFEGADRLQKAFVGRAGAWVEAVTKASGRLGGLSMHDEYFVPTGRMSWRCG